jgi:hypothetical protein
MSGQQAVAKGAYLLPSCCLCQKQPQVATTTAFLQIDRNIFFGQIPGQVAQALPGLGVIRIQDEIPRPALLVKKICAQRDLTSQVVKQVAHVQWFADADVAAVVKLPGVKIPPLDEPLSQHQGWAREFGVWKEQVFALYHRITSVAHLGSVQQAIGRFASNPKHEYNT